MQYLGVNRVIVQCKYMGEVKTYDKPAFNFVRWTSDQEGEQITIDDPDVDVEISVEDVSSSILQEAVDAAFSAADRANEAAEEAEHMVDIHTGPAGKSPYIGENGHWYEWDEETHQYVDTETNAKGDTGETPDISIGTVTTVEPGTPAAASMGGTPEAPVLNLSIPKGAVGATPNFTVGTVTTGQPGTPVVITITGTAEAPVLNITIPQGLKGDTGVSADYPITIHNGLDSDATDEALAAAQGKILDGKVSQLEAKVDKVKTVFNAVYNLFMSATYKEDVTNKMSVLRAAIDQFDDIPLTGLSISGENEVSGAAGITSQYIVNLTPDNTTQTEVRWSITSGGSYATIDATTGLLTVLAGASSNNVTIRVTSVQNNSIYAEKTITVTGMAYTQLSYIQTGPNTYVDTGITPTSDMTIYTRAARVSNNTELILGCYESSTVRLTTSFLNNGQTKKSQALYCLGVAKSKEVTIGQIVTMETSISSPFVSFTTGTNESTLTACSPASGPSIYLYAVHGSDETLSSAKVYNAKFYKGGDLIADFIPVLVGNSTPMVLNLISMHLYQFVGSGTINYE